MPSSADQLEQLAKSIARTAFGQRKQQLDDRLVITRLGMAAVNRSTQTHVQAGSGIAHPMRLPHEINQIVPFRRLQSFFAMTSLSALF
jgi:hypothetical protein